MLSLSARRAVSVMVEDCVRTGALPKPTLTGLRSANGMPVEDAMSASSHSACIIANPEITKQYQLRIVQLS